MGTRFFYRKTKSFGDPIIVQLSQRFERSLVISDDGEFLPKLVVGRKKRRRSRPQMHNKTTGIDDFSLTDSDNSDEDHQHHSLNGYEFNNMHVPCSALQTDLPNSRRRVRPTQKSSGSNKLKRCSSMPARKQINKLNNSRSSKTITIKKQRNSSSTESLDAITTPPPLMETLSARSIVKIWTQANILNGSGILLSLGFDKDEVNLSQLIKVLEDELRTVEDDSQSNMMRALVTLQSAKLNTLRQAYRQLHEENVKLRADNKKVNRRVSLLTEENDERLASLEYNTKKQIQVLELRHADVLHDLSLRIANDRDNWSNLNSRLEAQITKFEQEEIELKTELELIVIESTDLYLEYENAQKQITDLLETNIKLNEKLSNINETKNSYENNLIHRKRSDEDMLQLMEKISTLQMENSQLRDENEELVIEVENLNHELTRNFRATIKKTTQTTNDFKNHIEQRTSIGSTSAMKRRGDSPSKALIAEENPRSGKLRKCTVD